MFENGQVEALDSVCVKNQQMSNEKLWETLRNPAELFLKTSLKNTRKSGFLKPKYKEHTVL